MLFLVLILRTQRPSGKSIVQGATPDGISKQAIIVYNRYPQRYL